MIGGAAVILASGTFLLALDPPLEEESFEDRRRPEAAPWVKRPYALELQSGLGAPLGLGGLAFDYSPSPGFSANLGAGIGGSTRSLQVAGTLRIRLILAHGIATGAEGGVSVGRYSEDLDCSDDRCPPEWHWDRAVWGNVGLLLEGRTDGGLTFRWSFGGTAIFNLTDAECVRCDETDEPGTWTTTIPYTMFAAGYAFGP